MYYKRLVNMAKEKTSVKYDDIPKKLEFIKKTVPEFHQEIHMIERQGPMLCDTLRDPKCALQELFKEDNLRAYFLDSVTVNIHYKATAKIVKQAVEEALKTKKIVRVLEIGARLCGLTLPILEEIKEYIDDGRVEYVFTDVNIAFFQESQEILAGYKNIRYQQLDIVDDIKSQNFVPNSMD